MSELSADQLTQVEQSMRGDTCTAHKILGELSPEDRMTSVTKMISKTNDLYMTLSVGDLLEHDYDPAKPPADPATDYDGLNIIVLQKTDKGMKPVYIDSRVPSICKTTDEK
jgi:hypothetical protein